jgi:hypothetical protein
MSVKKLAMVRSPKPIPVFPETMVMFVCVMSFTAHKRSVNKLVRTNKNHLLVS